MSEKIKDKKGIIKVEVLYKNITKGDRHYKFDIEVQTKDKFGRIFTLAVFNDSKWEMDKTPMGIKDIKTTTEIITDRIRNILRVPKTQLARLGVLRLK